MRRRPRLLELARAVLFGMVIMSRLAPCGSCGRHVRLSEAACPFCAAVFDDAFRNQPARARPMARLSRAALFVFGTSAAAVAGAACSTTDDTADHSDDDHYSDIALYGGPPQQGDDDIYVTQPMYGGPAVQVDASTDGGVDANDGGSESDAEAH